MLPAPRITHPKDLCGSSPASWERLQTLEPTALQKAHVNPAASPFVLTHTSPVHLNYCNCRCPAVPEPVSLPPYSSRASNTPRHTWGTKWGAWLARLTSGCRYLDPPPKDDAQPGPAKRFTARAPISPARSWGPKTLPWGALKTSAHVHYRSRDWDSLLLPLSFASATQCHSFSISESGSCRALCIRDQEPF